MRDNSPVSLSEDFKKNIWLVAFDMDQTSLDIHTSGIAVRDNHVLPEEFNESMYQPLSGKEVVNHVKDSIKKIIPALLKNKIIVAICTNTDVTMAAHPSLMGGRELVEYVLGNTFEEYPEICDKLIVEAWRGSLSAVQSCGKNNHLARVWERVDAMHKNYPIRGEMDFQREIRLYTGDYFQTLKQINPITRQAMIKHTLLIDDDIMNVELARRAGYYAYKVKETGLEMEDWENIMTLIGTHV